MTLLVLRDANQPVKQIQVSKPLVVAVPLLALLSISGLIVSLHMQSEQTISRLEDRLRTQNLTIEAVVTDKNEAIQRLQNEVIALSGQSKEMMGRMKKVKQLEAELQKFIDKHGDPQQLGKLSTLSWNDSSGIGGEFIAVHDNEIEVLAQETKDDFVAISNLLDEIEKNVPLTLRKAKQTEYSLSGTPSEWPTLSTRLTSNFGYRTDPFTGRAAFHAGIDIAGKVGDPIYAAGAGKVITTARDGSHGKYIVVEHPGGLQSWYLHLHDIGVSEGDTIIKGQKIGSLGNTGRSTGPHLHFEIVKGGSPINPLPYLD
ncbi:peptidoglycan DD-metalloendopeptidase family protein [Paenibacillus puldeungensis]